MGQDRQRDIPTRQELREHLVRTMIAGKVATPRQNNLLHYRRMAARHPYYLFGLNLKRRWSEADVLAMMAEKCGVDPDLTHFYGDDRIDPDLTIDALEAMAGRLSLAARRRERVVLATGHPSMLAPMYRAVSRELGARGCRVLTPARGWKYEMEAESGMEIRRLRYDDGVAMLEDETGRERHTHDPDAMRAMLAELAAESDDWPDVVIADHGWAGAAGEAGIATVGFADSNDPALFAGEVEGKITTVVPLDDGIPPHHYGLLTEYLLSRAGLIA